MPRPIRPRRILVVRYVNARGRRVKRGSRGARRVTEQTRTFYASVGGKRVSLGTSDEGAAWTELRRLLRAHADRAAGLADQYSEAATLPLARHVEDWTAFLINKGNGAKGVEQRRSDVTALASAAGWKRLGDITGDSCLAGLERLRQERGHGPRTRNDYLSHARQFVRWCCRPPGRLRADPLAGLVPVAVEVDLRHQRRVPSDEEVRLLLGYLEDARPRRGMSGPQRALGYCLCMASGFRAGELRSLSEASFDWAAGTVTVLAAYSKHRRTDTVHLPAWLVGELRRHFAAGGGCWPFPHNNPGQVLQEDLQACGVPYVLSTPRGPRFFDFHSLRKWFISWTARQPGISPKTLQERARHSDPRLTLKVYAEADTDELRASAEALPDPRPRCGRIGP